MSIRANIRKSLGLLDRFNRAEQGNIAVIFAIAILPVLASVGAAVDYSRANNARTAMQAALDSTALMLSRDLSSGTIAPSDVATKAQSYFNALYNNAEAYGLNVVGSYTVATATKGSTVQVTGSGTISTQFMKVMGMPTMNFNTSSTTAWGNSRLRVALALDNTGSMASDGKITALKTASKNLIDQLSPLAKNPGDVYISIVPFSKDVNFGSANYAQTWIDWTDWEAEAPDLVGTSQKPSNWTSYGPGSTCPWSMQNDGFTCVTGPGSTTATLLIPLLGTYKGYICPGPDPTSRYGFKYHYLINGCYDSVASGSKYTHTWHPNAHSNWSGCFTDRTKNYDITNTAPLVGTAASMFPAEQYYENSESYCVSGNTPPLQAITPLSYDFSDLKTKIDAMQPTGGTNQPIGLAWAWQSLSQGLPMNAPAEDPNYTYKKAIILLSDGLNTEDRDPADGDGSSQTGTRIDDRQKLMCDNIKAVKDAKGAAVYTIYTIHVNTGKPADPTSTVLQYCASSADKFFMLTDATAIVTAFATIGTDLTKLRIAY
jgi:Flp pilus assembly protein TadG